MSKRKPMGYWNKPEAVDRVFDELKEKLGKVPTGKEFTKAYGGAINSLFRGNYHPGIRTWTDYLIHRGEKGHITRWTPEKIDKVFDELREELGRVPGSADFTKKHSAAMKVIRERRYNPNIGSWNAYLEHRKEEQYNERGKWTPEEIDRAYDELKEKLGRVPKSTEFRKLNSGALRSIDKGGYNSDIGSWNEYLEHRGEKPHRPRKDRLDILENLLEDEEDDE